VSLPVSEAGAAGAVRRGWPEQTYPIPGWLTVDWPSAADVLPADLRPHRGTRFGPLDEVRCRRNDHPVPELSIEPLTFTNANALQRALRRIAATGPGAWLFARVLYRIDRPVFRATRGRHTFASLLSGIPVVMITTTGARSGRPRTVPVLGLPTADGFAVIASNFGQRRHPGWYHNLRAHPEGSLTVDGQSHRFRAVEAEGDRRREIWEQGLRVYPGWSQYERRASNRRIAVFVLERA
jgi:deazaflavin-dependent oxidoreductase (nitroreductase family)